MSNVNTNTQATTTNTTPAITAAKKPTVARLHAATAKVNAAIVATGSTVVNATVAGHAKGKEWVAFVIDKTDNTSFLVKGDSAEGAIAIAKEVAKTTVRGLIKVIAVPVAYLSGFTYGFWKEVYETLKTSYTNYKVKKLETVENDPKFKEVMAKAEAAAEVVVEDNVNPNA